MMMDDGWWMILWLSPPFSISPGRCWRILTPCWGPKAPKTPSPRRWMHSAPRKTEKKMHQTKKQRRFFGAHHWYVGKKNTGTPPKKNMAKFVWRIIFLIFLTWFIDCLILKNCHCVWSWSYESPDGILWWMVDCHGCLSMAVFGNWLSSDPQRIYFQPSNVKKIWWFVPWRSWINLPLEYHFVPSRCQIVTFCRQLLEAAEEYKEGKVKTTWTMVPFG